MGRQKELVSRCGEMLHIRYRLLRQALAECLGTLILVVSGGDPEKPFCPSAYTPHSLCSLESCVLQDSLDPSPSSDPRLAPFQSALSP